MDNKLSVWTFSYRPTYYLTHPWKFFKDIYWNFRNWVHRANHGYAYVDVWNFCDWYSRVGAEALRYLAKHHSGYPGVKPWSTPEEWTEYLNYLANRLDRCANSMEIDFGEERNEYAEEFHKMHDALPYHREELPNGSIRTWRDETPEYIALRDKYWKRAEELAATDKEYRIKTFNWIGEDLPHLWD